jgi:hypothetical protein
VRKTRGRSHRSRQFDYPTLPILRVVLQRWRSYAVTMKRPMEWSYNPDLRETVVLDGEEVSRWRGFDYYYDAEAIAEPANYADEAKYDNDQNGLHSGVSHAGSGSSTRKFKKIPSGWHQNQRDLNTLRQRRKGTGHSKPHNGEALNATSHQWPYLTRNKRSVWALNTPSLTRTRTRISRQCPKIWQALRAGRKSARGCDSRSFCRVGDDRQSGA